VAGVSIGKLLQVLAALDECSEALSDALRATALQVPVVAICVRKRRNSTWLLYLLSRPRQDFWHSTSAGRLARSQGQGSKACPQAKGLPPQCLPGTHPVVECVFDGPMGPCNWVWHCERN